MILSMSNQAVIFLTTVFIGFIIGFVYDIFRVIRKVIYHPDFITYFEDAVYWLIVSVIMFYVMLNKNYGEIRFFSIFGAFLGMIIYFLTLSRFFMKVSLSIVGFLRKLCHVIFNIIMAPFKLVYKLLYNPISFCKKKSDEILLKIKKLLHKSKNYARIKKGRVLREFNVIFKKI